jgi:glucokinase
MNKAIGLDIGGTKIAVALVDTTGQILSRTVLATEAERGFGRAVDRMGKAIETVAALAGCAVSAVAGIGVGCAGPVDPLHGLISNPFTLTGWDRCDLVTPLRALSSAGLSRERR